MTEDIHIRDYIDELQDILANTIATTLQVLVEALVALRNRDGRLFCIGVGGGAANASHAVNDFRKLCGIEAYAPTDNVSELTARTNDEGWQTVFARWLEVSRLNAGDALLIFSVGGGDSDHQISVNLMDAIDLARLRGAKVWGIVGRSEGYTAMNADIAIVMPKPVRPRLLTPLTESYQTIIHHCLVSHPDLQQSKTTW